MTKKVLIVCLGNICRSPMAEAMLRHRIEERGLSDEIEVSSRATSNWNVGQAPHAGTRKKLAEYQIDDSGIFSEQIKSEDFETYDVILGMDKQNIKDLKRMAPLQTHDKIHLYLSVLDNQSVSEVPDPYYTGDFDETYQLLYKATNRWLDEWENE